MPIRIENRPDGGRWEPTPESRSGGKYPWHALNVGESFVTAKWAHEMRSQADKAERRHRRVFKVEAVGKGSRVTRLG